MASSASTPGFDRRTRPVVKGDGLQRVRSLERFGVLDENAVLGRNTGRHDCRRRSKA